MSALYYFIGLIASMFVGIGIGYFVAVFSGHADDPDVKAKLESMIEKVKGIDPDPNYPNRKKGKHNG